MRKDQQTGWDQHSKLVLAELKRLNEQHERFNKVLTMIQVEIATLKAKSAMWGAIAGSGLTVLLWVMDHRK